jgi:hypothetical protein
MTDQTIPAKSPTDEELTDPRFLRGLLDVMKTLLTVLVGFRAINAGMLERDLRGDVISSAAMNDPVRGRPAELFAQHVAMLQGVTETLRMTEQSQFDAVCEQLNFDRGIIEILGVLIDHLAERGAVDRAYFRGTLEERVAVWTNPTADHPKGRNPQRAQPLQMLLGAILSPPSERGKVN